MTAARREKPAPSRQSSINRSQKRLVDLDKKGIVQDRTHGAKTRVPPVHLTFQNANRRKRRNPKAEDLETRADDARFVLFKLSK